MTSFNEQYRSIGKLILTTVLNSQKNIDIIEHYIYNSSENTHNLYLSRVYDAVGEIIQHGGDKKALKQIIQNLMEKNIEWNHPMFLEYNKSVTENDYFKTSSIDIEEGVLECYRCGSKKTISYQRQTRSADEGATTFAICVKCNNSWRHNN